MLRVTYIYHSGFCVETEESYFIFDYYKGQLPVLDGRKRVYVFASHFHHDHYNPAVFALLRQQGIPSENIEAVLAADIRKKNYPGDIRVLRAGGNKSYTLSDGINVETLYSTDSGVAYLVTVKYGGKDSVIYHAGDLNDWCWEEESKEYNHNMTVRYRREIDKIAGRRIDAAFVPLDVRQEADYDRGILYFLEKANAGCVYPMHYWEHPEVIKKFLEEHPQYCDIIKNTEEFGK